MPQSSEAVFWRGSSIRWGAHPQKIRACHGPGATHAWCPGAHAASPRKPERGQRILACANLVQPAVLADVHGEGGLVGHAVGLLTEGAATLLAVARHDDTRAEGGDRGLHGADRRGYGGTGGLGPQYGEDGAAGDEGHTGSQNRDDKKNSNSIYWSPKGRFVVIATIANTQSSDLDFFDLDFEGERPEGEKDLTACLQLLNTADHYGVTDLQWDPSGRFVASWASAWKHSMENGYHLYDFRGEQLREELVEKFKQWLWRPCPPTLLTKDEQKQVRKNLREYSKIFEQEDAERGASADLAVVEERRRILDEWLAWRASVEEELAEDRLALGLPEKETPEAEKTPEEGEAQVIEKLAEEVLEETEEIVA
ncbi:uncharacterized protein B0I36DRAFT_356107 [Microdochium trichocladiopsis]|uniref:Translation initiation factor beta propellor-like domain-containing protein n=1 Tax=Microdochium trichocladiopsis TaxID=1682393 RepID=A0A9P9BIX1_9PEZI|nr:uncharacterized protein B0I36DRAFT_356107 [Microdochium trichocladiopsis]KAH7012743.1 hypothetical protein B0I36DRAFT_356107 [Microdochium trichocladiopsis]